MVSLKKILNKILKSLTGVETRTLLWTNASPTSEFGAQTVGTTQGVDLSGYDSVIIVFSKTASSNSERQECRCKVGETVQSVFGGGFSYASGKAAVGCYIREAYTSTTGVQFNGGTDVTTVGNDGICLPYRIYGIKEV